MQRWSKHILFWIGVYILWLYMKTFGNIAVDNLIINLVHVSAYMAVYYTLREVLLPRYFERERWLSFAMGLLVSTLIIFVIWIAILYYISDFVVMHSMTIPCTLGGYILESIQMFVPGMILLAEESYEAQDVGAIRRHQLEKESITNELNYLKAKINPQFIFNTLNNLKVLVDKKSSKAPEMILRLSEVLDYVLYRSQRDRVKLEEEIKVIRGFLALEKLRLGDKVNIQLDAKGSMLVDISPLTILIVVENTLKQNIINQSDRLDVLLDITSENKKINCNIIIQKNDRLKVLINGLTDIRRQLTLTYPDQHTLIQKEDAESIITSLTLFLI